MYELLLRQTVAQLEKERKKLDSAIAAIRDLLKEPTQLQLPDSMGQTVDIPQNVSFGKMAISLLKEKACPMKTRDIYEVLKGKGVNIASVSSLYSSLKREKEILLCSPSTWTLKESGPTDGASAVS